MSWRIVSVAKRAYISTSQNQMVIKNGEGDFRIPLEDIGTIILEDHSITATNAFLSSCAEHKIAVLLCDNKHLPNAVLLPYQQHSRQSAVLKKQIGLSKPFQKRLWQKIVKQKIINQSEVISVCCKDAAEKLLSYSCKVGSGDPNNREATAARLYFSVLLPDGITRGTEHPVNSALNYGYAIVRGVVARSLAGYGFLTSLGINHINELNNYALADDLLEPFRPFVDWLVRKINLTKDDSLTVEHRQYLQQVLTLPVSINKQKQTLQRAVEISAQSLVSAVDTKDPELLLLPSLTYD